MATQAALQVGWWVKDLLAYGAVIGSPTGDGTGKLTIPLDAASDFDIGSQVGSPGQVGAPALKSVRWAGFTGIDIDDYTGSSSAEYPLISIQASSGGGFWVICILPVDATGFNIRVRRDDLGLPKVTTATIRATGTTKYPWATAMTFLAMTDGTNFTLDVNGTQEITYAETKKILVNASSPISLGGLTINAATKNVHYKALAVVNTDTVGEKPDISTLTIDARFPDPNVASPDGAPNDAFNNSGGANKRASTDDWASGSHDTDTTYIVDPGVANTTYRQHLKTITPPVLFGAATSAQYTASSSSTSHTIPAGTNRLLVVHVLIGNGVTAGIQSTSVTWSGAAEALTLLGATDNPVSFATLREEWWYLIAPSTGTGTVDVVLNDIADHVVIVESYTNVNQTSPVGTYASAIGTSTAPSLDITSANGELVVDGVVAANAAVQTVGAGQTSRGTEATANMRGSSSEEVGAATVTMSWTLASSRDWIVGAAPLKPLSTPSSPINVAVFSLFRATDATKNVECWAIISDGTTNKDATAYENNQPGTTYIGSQSLFSTAGGGGAWSQAEVNNLQIGRKSVIGSQAVNQRCTAQAAEVLSLTFAGGSRRQRGGFV